MRAVFQILFALILSVVLCGQLKARVLERGNGPEPDSLDPHRGQSLSAQNILRDIFEGLTREDANGTIIPGLAERWEISPDGLRWSDGGDMARAAGQRGHGEAAGVAVAVAVHHVL